MGVSFDYRCNAKLGEEQRLELLARVKQDVAAFSWWVESIKLRDTDNGFWGSTKIFLHCEDEGEDSIMAWWNITHIMKLLQEYARSYGLVWSLEIEGGSLGEISGGDSDREVFDEASTMLQVAGVDANDPRLPDRIREIDMKYADRRSRIE